MLVLGIDPGLKGAAALWDGKGLILKATPILKAAKRGNELNYVELAEWFNVMAAGADHAFIELVGSRPGEGSSSSFKFGLVTGAMHGLIAASGIPKTTVQPHVWKAGVGVKQAKEAKQAAVARALEIWPQHSADFHGPKGGILDGLAEAALIAYYGRSKLVKELGE